MDFRGGYTGRCLEVDLTAGTVKSVPISPENVENYLGGRGLAAKMLFDRWKPGIEPFSAENTIVLATGPLNGTPTLLTPKYCVATISPLTGLYTKSLSGGHFAAELKYAGIDAIRITGNSLKPVYLAVTDGVGELRDAGKIWGKDNHSCEEAIRNEWGDSGVSVASIGVAGERLVRFASVTNDRHRSAGRGGVGAVMGYKKLKAIAVRGTGGVRIADVEGFRSVLGRTYEGSLPLIEKLSRRRLGTPELVDIVEHFGMLPVRNFSQGVYEKKGNVNAEAFRPYVTGDRACFSCNLACGKVTRIPSGPHAGTTTEGPEYESIGMLGPNLDIDSPEFLIRADVLCDEYGIDTISSGATIGLAIDMFERGLLSEKDTGGLELRWGDADTALDLLRMLGERKPGFGEELGEGSRRLAERYGAVEIAPHSKGQEFPAYDPRGAQGFALQYATSNRGACHLTASVFSAEITSGKVDRYAVEGKAQMVRDAAIFVAHIECGIFCLFMRYILGMDDVLEFFKTVTGRTLTIDEANTIGERIYTLERLINIGQGITREQDCLPEKFLTVPMSDGPAEGQVVRLHEMLDEHYALMGYDAAGRPTPETLARLGLEEEAKKV